MISRRGRAVVAALRVRNAAIARQARRSHGGQLTSADDDARFARAAMGLRRSFGGFFQWLARPVAGVAITTDEAGPVPVTWSIPGLPTRGRTILYLHGGSYVAGAPEHYVHLTSHLAAASQAEVATPSYRLAPEHPYPAAIDDAVATYRWLLDRARRPTNIVLAGDSAGGGLALGTALAIRDQDLPLPAGVAVMSPWTDLTASGETVVTNEERDVLIVGKQLAGWGRVYAGDAVEEPYASPLFADLRDLPPIHVQVGGNEVLLDDAQRFVDAAIGADVDAVLHVDDGLFHVAPLFLRLVPEARSVLDRVADFVIDRTPTQS